MSKVIDLGSFKKSRNQHEHPAILIIGGDSAIHKALKRVFEREGYKVTAASSRVNLKTVLEENEIKIMIIDVELVWIEGLELCRVFRRHESYKDIPIIVISAKAGDDNIKKATLAGCDAYITKPFNMDDLIDTVSSMLNVTNIS